MSDQENGPKQAVEQQLPHNGCALLGMLEVVDEESDAKRARQPGGVDALDSGLEQVAEPGRIAVAAKAPIVVKKREPKPKPQRKPGPLRRPAIENWEIAIVKAMLDTNRYDQQSILSYFTRPTRTVNLRVISQINSGKRGAAVPAATVEEMSEFLTDWPDTDQDTGLSTRGDELVIKAREAMIAAVHTHNSAGLTFKAELFVVTAMIAWTYLMLAYYIITGLPHTYPKRDGEDFHRLWDLKQCIKTGASPLPELVKENIKFLSGLRDEIEHRATGQIDEAVAMQMQACCINFNDTLKRLFGERLGLEKRVSIALQFRSFNQNQREVLKTANLPAHISTYIDGFNAHLTPKQLADPAYQVKTAFTKVSVANAHQAEAVVKFAPYTRGCETEPGVTVVMKKYIEKEVVEKQVPIREYTQRSVVAIMKDEGYRLFSENEHGKLWKVMDGKNPANGFGRIGAVRNQWLWFDGWVEVVRKHCCENRKLYGFKDPNQEKDERAGGLRR